jgi:hypothetical protein
LDVDFLFTPLNQSVLWLSKILSTKINIFMYSMMQ